MIDIRLVTALDILDAPNADYLFDMYREESQIDEVEYKGNPDRDIYLSMEANGILTVAGVYSDDTLVGFLSIFMVPMAHYKNKLGATIESLFILPEYRAYGTGKRLIEFMENAAKDKGIEVMFMSAKIGTRLSKIAQMFGYNPTNITYTKAL